MARTHRLSGAAGALMIFTLITACSSDSSDSSATTTRGTKMMTTTTLGCKSAAADIGPGEEEVTVTSGGVERWYLRHVPRGYDGSKPLPLVVDLHGYSAGAEIEARFSELGAYGDDHNFITLTPQGAGPVSLWDTSLRGGDQKFIAGLLDDTESELCVDTDRIFVTGMSNGAMMTSALGCVLADRIAAIALVAGIRDPAGCAPSRPMPVLAFHGTDDGFLAYDGGYGESTSRLPAPDGSGRTLGDLGLRAGSGPSVPEMTAAWADRAGCDTTPTETAVAADVTLLEFGCPGALDVALYRIEGGGHTWPGSNLSAALPQIIGTTTRSISATELMWTFFETHPLEDG